MQNSILVKMLSKLPEKEIKEFSKSIKQRNVEIDHASKLSRLIEFLRRFHPEFESYRLQAKHIAHHVYGGPGNESKLPNLFTRLRTELDSFFWKKYAEDHPVDYHFGLLRMYKKYEMHVQSEAQIKKINKILAATVSKDSWYWMDKMSLAYEHYYYPGVEQIANQKHQIYDALTYLDLHHAALKLKLGSELLNRHNVLKEPKPEILFLDEILDNNFGENSFLHGVFQKAYLLLRDREDRQFFELKSIIIEEWQQFSNDDQFILFSYLLNHTSYNIRKGKNEFLIDALEFYKFALEKKIFISGGYFNHFHYLNIIDVACQLSEYEWVENFIQNFENQLSPKKKEELQDYTLAFLAFSKGDFQSAHDAIAQLKAKDPFSNLRMRWLFMVCQFELNEDAEHIKSLCDAIDKYVQRQRVFSEEYSNGVYLGTKIVRGLIKFTVNRDKLKNEWNKASTYYYKTWLEEKLFEK